MAPEKITQYPETDLWDFLRDLVIPGRPGGLRTRPYSLFNGCRGRSATCPCIRTRPV